MSKKDRISEMLDADHSMNYKTGKFESVEDSVVAEDTYKLIETKVSEVINESDYQESGNEIVESEPQSQDEIDYLADEEMVKENIKSLIADGMDLIGDLYETVRITEQPKSFEYAAIFMKTLIEMNESLLDVHDRKKKRNAIKTKDSNTTISQVNNNIHIHESKPTDLLKRLKSKRK